MIFFTEEEILDKHIGKIGTPHRNQFEDEINTFLIGEVIKEVVFLRYFLNIGGLNMIEIKETLVIKSDSPKVAD